MSLRKLAAGTSLIGLALLTALPASAQSSDDMGFDILQLLVDEGVIPREKAQLLLEKARAQGELRRANEKAATATAIDVPYVPEAVREQIKTQVKTEMLADAKKEGWIGAAKLPNWVERISISGDLRLRYQGENFGEDNLPFFPDVAAINAAGGSSSSIGFPLLNSTVDRHRTMVRARLNVEAAVSPKVTVGFGLATGENSGAVSTDSTLGDLFDRKDFWVDHAYVKLAPFDGVALTAGRMRNPFYSTDLVWDPDISPEGAVLSGRTKFSDSIDLFAVGGVLPLQEREVKKDAYLYAGQIGGEAKFGDAFSAKLAGAYYYYQNIQSSKDPANGSRLNDWTAPRNLSKGNSVFNIRTDGTTTLVGLASRFELGVVTGRLKYSTGETAVSLTGEVVKNFGLNRTEVARLRAEPSGDPGVASRSLGWQARLDAGYPRINEAGQWRAAAAYKYVGSDAVLDIFTDSEFALGGTDVRGYVLEAEYGIFKNTGLEVRYLSSDSIDRPPFAVDVFQINLNTRF